MIAGVITVALCVLSNVAGMQVLTIGDFGDDSSGGVIRQEELSLIMSDWCGVRKCDFIISTGDNFYPSGVTSVNDARFNTSWLWVYDKPNIADLTWYMTMGNHDYGVIDNRELYQIDYAATEKRWVQPSLWYDVVRTEGNLTVHFVYIDAMSILLRKYDWEEELEWYEKTLAESTADWLIVVEHYPPYTVGGYATGSLIHRTNLVPPAEKHGVDLLISGHDHNLQHITKSVEVDVDYVVSGGGGRGLYAFDTRGNQTLNNMGYTVQYFGHHNGFVMLDISREAVVADYVDLQGKVQYSFTRTRSQRRRK